MTRKVEVLVDGDSRGFNSSIDQASGKVTGFGSIVKGVGLGIGAGFVGLAAGGVSELIGKLGEASTAFQEDAASAAKLETALANNIPAWNGNTDAIEERIAAQMRLGFSDDEQRDSLALLTGFTNDLSLAQEAQAAAMDLARLKGIDLSTASEAVGKALDGQMRGLKSVGIELDSNATATEVLAAITKTAGGQAEAFAEGPMGKQAAAQLKVGEAMEKLGGAVNQVASVALPIAAEAFTIIIDVFMEVWSVIGPIVSALVTELTPAFRAIAGFISGTVIPVIRTLFSTILPPLRAGISALAPIVRTTFGIVTSVIGAAVSVVKVALGGAGTAFKVVQGVIVGVVTTIRNVVNNLIVFFGGIGARISSATKGMWNGILGAFRGVINTIIRGWNSISFTVPRIDTPFGSFGGFTLGTPNIPYLAKGGVATRAGSVIVGEQGPEMLNMPRGASVVPLGRGGGSGGGDIHIHIGTYYGSDKDIDRLSDRIAFRMRARGYG